MSQVFGGSGGTPAGTNTQIQFNNAGAFGASANLTFDPATNIFALGGRQTITQGTITALAPILDATTTWNNAGVTFTGIRYNVTDTASNTNSLIMDLQRNAVSRFSVRQDGIATAVEFRGTTAVGCRVDTGYFFLGTSADALLYRDAANIFAQRNLASQQTFRIYNTTDAGVTNFERLSIGWSGTTCTIATEQGGTGVGRVLNIQASDGIQFRTNGANTRWIMPNTGHLTCFTDNAFDIGASGANRPRNIFIAGGITHGSTTLLTTTVALTNGAGVASGTLTNAPAAGNPTKWIPINDNGTTRHIPAW